MRSASENVVTVIKDFEQFRAKPYKALASEPYYTAGWGHMGPDVDPAKTYTEAQAMAWLKADLAKFAAQCDKYVHQSATQAQFDAIVDLTFNVGTGCIMPDDIKGDFDDHVRAGNWAEVRKRIPQFRNGRINGKLQPLLGLVRRRAADVALFDGKTGAEAVKIGRAATF